MVICSSDQARIFWPKPSSNIPMFSQNILCLAQNLKNSLQTLMLLRNQKIYNTFVRNIDRIFNESSILIFWETTMHFKADDWRSTY